jgi:hypothetical protein
MRTKIKESMTKQFFIRQQFGNISVSESYVDSFYNVYQDSLPSKPAGVRLDKIIVDRRYINNKIGDSDSVVTLIHSSITAETDFEDFALDMNERFSDHDIIGSNGVAFEKGDLATQIEDAIYPLEAGSISSPIDGPQGKFIARKIAGDNDKIEIDFILIKSKLNPVQDFINNLTERLTASPDSFDAFVELYSHEDSLDLPMLQGDVFYLDNMSERMGEMISKSSPGDILEPLVEGDMGVIYRYVEVIPEQKMTLEDDYDQLYEIASQNRMGQLLESYLDRIQSEVYVEIRRDVIYSAASEQVSK